MVAGWLIVGLVAVVQPLAPTAARHLIAACHPIRMSTSPLSDEFPEKHSTSPLSDEFPEKHLEPLDVVELELRALQEGNTQVAWRFISPDKKRAIGIKSTKNRHFPFLKPPDFHAIPVFAPLVRHQQHELVGALPISKHRYQCRARVWPAGGDRECGGESMPSPPTEYIFALDLQPLVRPVCYEDDPLQQGISTGPPFGGCWLVDEVRVDERWGGGDGGMERLPNDHGDGGVERPLATQPQEAHL